jgi:hypothetical protein
MLPDVLNVLKDLDIFMMKIVSHLVQMVSMNIKVLNNVELVTKLV